MKTSIQTLTIGWLVILALLFCDEVHADVVVTQGLFPDATSWPGTPLLATVASPASDTVGESFNGGGGNASLSQTFTIATTNYLLQTIDIYVSGGSGGNVTLNLFDLGIQTAPNPGSYTGGGNLLGSGFGLPVTYTTQAASILQFAFTGADKAYLQAGHIYAFELTGTFNSQPIFWERSSGDTYSGGTAYRSESWLNGAATRDFSLAVYANVTSQSPPPIVTQCTVDWNTVFQRIDGFGASSAWNPNWTTALADMFFSTNTGIGLSLLRNHITPTGSTVETSIMQWAQARGARVWSTPWSPPASLKSANTSGVISVNGGALISSTNNYQTYATQLANYVLTMKATYGVNLYALSMQNEPDVNTSNYESCIWTSQQFHDFVPYLATALSNRNLSATKIITAEDEHWQFNLTTNIINDSNTAPLVGILAAHNYGSTAAPVNTHGKDLWETEVSLLSGNDSSISNGVYWAGQIHQFLTVAQVNAWHYWWLMNGNSTGNESLLDINGTPAKRMYALGNFSRFIRPNFYRIGVPTNTGPLQISAYKDLISSNFVLVAINSGNSSVTQIFNLVNFTAGTVTPWITSSNLSLASNAPIAVSGSVFTNVLPPMSIVSFVGQANRAPNAPTNLSPANLAIAQSLTPTLQASAFTDPDTGNTQSASEWIIQNASDNSLVLDTEADAVNETNFTVPTGLLAYGTAYNWQVRYADNNSAWSSYSMSTTFSTITPNLQAVTQNGNLVLSWPANASGFSLQYATNLDPAITNWMTYPFSAVVIGDFNVLTNYPTNGFALFFRLKKP